MTDFLGALREELLDGLERYERVPTWRRPPRWRIHAAVRLATAAALVAAAVVAVVLAASHPADVERAATPPVTRLEGFHATCLVELDGSLWAGEYNSSSLLRIDPRTGKIVQRIDVGGSPGTVLAAGGAVWVQDWERGRLVKVDPHTGRIASTLTLRDGGDDIAFAAGALWVAGGGGSLTRVDPGTATISRRVPLGIPTDSNAPGVTAAGDTLWVTAGTAIVEVDARTRRVVGRARGPFLPIEFSRRAAADAGGLWLSSPTRREVWHFDARTLEATDHRVGGDPSTVAIVDGRLWVATVHDDEPLTRVTVLDAGGHVLRTIPVPHPATGIFPSPGGGAWVTFGEDQNLSPAAVHVSAP